MAVRKNISDLSLSELSNLLDNQLFDLREQLKIVEEFAKISSKDYSKEEAVMKNIEPSLEPFWDYEDQEQELIDADYEDWLDLIEMNKNY